MISAQRARLWIAVPWLVVFAIVVVGLTVNIASGGFETEGQKFSKKAEALVSWFMSAMLPTTGLIVSALAADALSTTRADRVGKPYFFLSLGASALYLVTVLVVVYAVILAQLSLADIGLADTLIVGPAQGIVSGALGIFFLSARQAPVQGEPA